MQRERTFIMVKPDGVQRGLVGDVIGRLERKGLQAAAIKMMQISPDLAARHYGEHKGKPFYESLINFITSGPVVAMVWEGDNAVSVARSRSEPLIRKKRLRGLYAVTWGSTGNNIVHGSDSRECQTRNRAFL